ncbi:MAG: Mur ligase family protein, partial [Thermoplasmata archaeon]
GLGFDRCSVGVVTNIREDHIGLNGVEDMEDLFWIKSLVLETTEEGGHCVINGNDDFAERLIERANGQIVLFSMEKNTLIDKNISAGVPVFVLEGEELFAYIDGEPQRLAHVSEIPFLAGTVSMMVENTLAALATAYSSGFPLEKAVEALKTFETNEEMCPGRLNLYDVNGVKVLFDYAHNQDALVGLANYVKGLKAKKTKFIYMGLGDRSDVSMIKNGFEAGKHFDELIFSEKEDQLRGRESGVISSLLKIGAGKAGKEAEIILQHREALDHVLENSSEGDMVICANLDYTSEDLKQYIMKTEKEEEYVEEIKALGAVETAT